MRPLTVHAVISAPREEIFDFIVDLSRRPAWTDHWQRDYRLARVNAVGKGAAARFVVRPPLRPRFWVELTIAEADRPRRVVEQARYSRVGRSRLTAVYDLVPEGHGTTRVEMTVWTEPTHFMDKLKEVAFARGWMRRKATVQLRRLRAIFEDPPEGELARVRIAGFEPQKKPRFGA